MTSITLILVHSDRDAQIASLLMEEVKILDKYSDFVNIFSEKKALVLPERIDSISLQSSWKK